ncbi:hypothetical protein C8R45DRAFT_1224522 [Mycena sanguinolenta]|nr:hypothetical protein C8R45DRAFT_1224522 [Mycena sanguinolenta]
MLGPVVESSTTAFNFNLDLSTIGGLEIFECRDFALISFIIERNGSLSPVRKARAPCFSESDIDRVNVHAVLHEALKATTLVFHLHVRGIGIHPPRPFLRLALERSVLTMFREGNESTSVINISGGRGGDGGRAGERGVGGRGGAGEGPTFNYGTVGNVTNNIVNQDQVLEEVLYKWLESPPDMKDRQYELRGFHHRSTGHWLLRNVRFIKWKDTPGSLWIKGISGTGKSVLSSTVIEEITLASPKQSAVAYFYFDFRNERQHMHIMLRSIIWQLSGQSPSPYGALHQLYEELKNGTIQPHCIHLQHVLKVLLLELDHTYIVIDGLDECIKTDRKRLIEFIQSLCQSAEHTPHLLFTSQPLEDFKTAFKNITFFELGSSVTNNDIRSFIGSEVPRLGNWASHNKNVKHVTEQIVQKSNGMFRMAACLLIELGHCHWEEDWEETLTVLPADLFGIYSRFFTRAKNTPRLPIVFIQAIFRWLVFSARQITSDELADAIAFRLNSPVFDFSNPDKSIYYPNRRQGNFDIFKLLEGLIVIKNNDFDSLPIDDLDSLSSYDQGGPSIALAHSSVKDYILSLQFQQEFSSFIDIREYVSHKFITQTCSQTIQWHEGTTSFDNESPEGGKQSTYCFVPIAAYPQIYGPCLGWTHITRSVYVLSNGLH